MNSSKCIRCDVVKPLWSTHRLCPKCRTHVKKIEKTTKGEITSSNNDVINADGEKVEIKNGPVVKFDSKKNAVAHTHHWQKRCNGALTKYCTTIWLGKYYFCCYNQKKINEMVAQTLNCEAIHLAMYACGLGKENCQFDKAGYHTWNSEIESLRDYHGVNITRLGWD